jgi:hypothetical protein
VPEGVVVFTTGVTGDGFVDTGVFGVAGAGKTLFTGAVTDLVSPDPLLQALIVNTQVTDAIKRRCFMLVLLINIIS